jgi:3',5'-cyclic-nucleotide phosphodiesterase
MYNIIKSFVLLYITCCSFHLFATELDTERAPVFELVVLGDSGGGRDGNLSAFLLRDLTDDKYVALDTGTLLNGIEESLQQNAFSGLKIDTEQKLTPSINILRNHIAGYLISHGHLDHIAGLLVVSPDDNAKPIYALPSVNKAIVSSYFNWQAWPNFSNRGNPPSLNKYQMVDLPLTTNVEIADTSLKVSAFSLSHPVESTAFVIENDKDIMVYFGDTGPDELEKENKIEKVWQYLAEQVKSKNLRGIVIEASFPDSHPDKYLYGHLTPKWLTKELINLSSLLDEPAILKSTKVIVSHVKSSTLKGVDASAVVQSQLQQHNKLGLHFVMAKQGHKILL